MELRAVALLIRDEARRIIVAKLPELVRRAPSK
jgi:hypothetical protein